MHFCAFALQEARRKSLDVQIDLKVVRFGRVLLSCEDLFQSVGPTPGKSSVSLPHESYPYGRKLCGSRGTKLSDIFHLLLVALLWLWWQKEIIETRFVRRRRDFPTITTSWCCMSGFSAPILQRDLQNTLEICAGKLKSIILLYIKNGDSRRVSWCVT